MIPVLDMKVSNVGATLISDSRSLRTASGSCRHHNPTMQVSIAVRASSGADSR